MALLFIMLYTRHNSVREKFYVLILLASLIYCGNVTYAFRLKALFIIRLYKVLPLEYKYPII